MGGQGVRVAFVQTVVNTKFVRLLIRLISGNAQAVEQSLLEDRFHQLGKITNLAVCILDSF